MDKVSKKIISIDDVRKFIRDSNISLSSEEFDYIILSMYKESRCLKKLAVKDMIELFKEVFEQYEEEDESPAVIRIDEIPEDSDEFPSKESESKKESQPPIADTEENGEPEIAENPEAVKESAITEEPANNSSPPIDQHTNIQELPTPSIQPSEELTEKEILETVQKVFSEIAHKLHTLNLKPAKLFEGITVNEELILASDFFTAIESLGIAELLPRSHECMLRILAADEDDNYVRLEDFVQVMNDYAQARKESESNELVEINGLSQIAVIVLFTLEEHLQKENVNVDGLFEDHIQQVSNEMVVNFKNFIETISEIGIKVEEGEIEDLRRLLQLDEQHPHTLRIKTLVKVLEQFSKNKEIREYGKQCLQELMHQDYDTEEHKSEC